jgi:hypothetical protein
VQRKHLEKTFGRVATSMAEYGATFVKLTTTIFIRGDAGAGQHQRGTSGPSYGVV